MQETVQFAVSDVANEVNARKTMAKNLLTAVTSATVLDVVTSQAKSIQDAALNKWTTDLGKTFRQDIAEINEIIQKFSKSSEMTKTQGKKSLIETASNNKNSFVQLLSELSAKEQLLTLAGEEMQEKYTTQGHLPTQAHAKTHVRYCCRHPRDSC